MNISFEKGTIEINSEKYEFNIGETKCSGIVINLEKKENIYSCSIINNNETDITIGNIVIDFFVQSNYLDRSYISSRSMINFDGIFENDKEVSSYSLFGLTNSLGNGALLFTYTDPFDANYKFIARPDGCDWQIDCICNRENTYLKSKKTLNIAPLKITVDNSLGKLLDDYGNNFKTKEFTEIKTGWCSWYHYYGQETQEDILKNVELLSKSPFKNKLDVIQIDDGWNLPSNEHPCVWGDWFAGSKFPKGMKYIADEIHKNGFQAGLWLAPFSVAIDSNLAKEHTEWFVKQDDSGLLAMNPGERYGLDLTNPEVLNFLKETFERVFDEWGFDYIKIDFLLHGAIEGKRYDNTKTSVEAFCMGMDIIRKVAKDRFILNCGSLIMPAAKYCDAMRIGADVGSRWYLPVNLEGWQHGNCAMKPAIINTLYRQWMHKKLWQNDPDCIVVRDKPCTYELNTFKDEFCGYKMTEDDFGLTENEAMFMVKVAWFTNTMKLISEVINELSSERFEMLERCFGSFELETEMVDFYVKNEIIILKTNNDNLYIGIFNTSDKEESVNLDSSRFNIEKWSFKEIFDEEGFAGEGEKLNFPIIQPRTAKIWKLE